MKGDPSEVVFTPGNEPYLGRELLFVFDNAICACLEQSGKIAPRTHDLDKSDLQVAACQLIPQSISIALSIRELLRQGYLFGAWALVRPLAERAAILLYLFQNPVEVEKWNRGWQHGEAPGLAKMIESLASSMGYPTAIKGHQATAALNSVLHGKPDSAIWSLTPLSDGSYGHAPSKQLSSPALCDEVCANVIPWLACVQGMMGAYFPELMKA